MLDLKVSNLEEAVKLANELKLQGKYNWFRGQTSPWPLVPTRGRVPDEQLEKAEEKLDRFYAFVQTTPGLEYLRDNEKAFFAVAQHYGLPTCYIDFSTDPAVAGYFATHGKDLKDGQESCIICLNTDDLLKFWKDVVPPEYPQLDIVEIPVDNLWRLEAQKGVFLVCPFGNLESWYPPSRILFSYTGPASQPTFEQIYPTRESQLEILLNQYFINETSLEGGQRWREHARRYGWITTEFSDPNVFAPDFPRGADAETLASWNQESLHPWLYIEVQQWQEAVSDELWEFDIAADRDPICLRDEISQNVRARLSASPSSRRKLIPWAFRFVGSSPNEEFQRQFQHSIHRLWDGLRMLPYSDEQIAQSIGTCVALNLLWLRTGKSKSRVRWCDVLAPCLNDPIEVEVASEDGGHSRGVVSQARLLAAARDDLADLIGPKRYEEVLKSPQLLLQITSTPQLLFEFDRLTDLFVEELAPSQVLMRWESYAVYFSPARLNIFGLP